MHPDTTIERTIMIAQIAKRLTAAALIASAMLAMAGQADAAIRNDYLAPASSSSLTIEETSHLDQGPARM
jgi:hypothetical protein